MPVTRTTPARSPGLCGFSAGNRAPSKMNGKEGSKPPIRKSPLWLLSQVSRHAYAQGYARWAQYI
jgi:hypothetical protein